MKKFLSLILAVCMVLPVGLVGAAVSDVAFANSPSDLVDWRGKGDDALLDDAQQSIIGIGSAFDALIMMIAKILISIIVTIIGIRLFWGKDAMAKKEVKGQIAWLVGGSIVVYFGIDILIKILEFFQKAFL